MTPRLTSLVAGIAGGIVASAVMNLFQTAATAAMGSAGSNEDPATVKAADTAKRWVSGGEVTQKHRLLAGSVVHYATGTALGVGYAMLARRWPPATTGFGVPFGLGVAVLLDDVAVPAFGWGSMPTDTAPATHVYGLASHAVFGLALEGTHRAVTAMLAEH